MKGKKLLAGILSAAMLAGTMAVPVFAENDIDITEEDIDLPVLSSEVALMSANATAPTYDWYDADATSYELDSLSDYLGFVYITRANVDFDGDGNVDINKTNFAGKTVTLKSDIDFSGRNFYKRKSNGSASTWYVGGFAGTFDGDNHTIKNLKISSEPYWYGNSVGLFYSIENGSEIKNLTVDGITVTTDTSPLNFGGIVYYAGGGSKLTNCKVKNVTYTSTGDVSYSAEHPYTPETHENVYYYIRTGGIVGGIASNALTACKIVNCDVENFTYTSSNYVQALGGLVGLFYISNSSSDYTHPNGEPLNGQITDCDVDGFTANFAGLAGFNGKAQRNFAGFGGMLGLGYSGNDKVAFDITNCHVTGLDATITDMESNSLAGGFVGTSRRKYNATNCSVQGTITAGCANGNKNCFVGGFTGAPICGDCVNMGDMNSWPTSEAAVTYCTSNVDITTTDNVTAGGFVGLSGSIYRDGGFTYNRRFETDYVNCSVNGTINSNTIAGGFAGTADRGNFDKCDTSEATVNGNVAGGFIGDTKSLVSDTVVNEKIVVNESKGTENVAGTTKQDKLIAEIEETSKISNIDINHYTVNGNTVDLGAVKVKTAAGVVTYYDSFEEALNAVTDDDTIILCQDTTIGTTTFKNSIDLNGCTLTLTGTNNHTYGDIKFSNGKIVANGLTTSAQGIFVVMSETLNFDNVAFTCNGLTGGCGYVIDAQDGKKFKAVNSKFYIDNFAGYGAAFGGGNPYFEFDGCEIKISNSTTGILHNATLKNTTYNATNMSGEALKVGGSGGWKITLDNSTVTVDGCENGVKLYPGTTLELINSSTLEVKSRTNAGILLKNDTANVDKSDNSTIKADIKTENVVGEIANTVKVSYEDVTVNEGEKVYNLYVEADDKTINRLTSAEFTFDLDTADAIDYVVSGTQKVNVTPDNSVAGRYLFNFNGIDAADITGKKINIGQIKFTGYGTFSFAITDGEAHATTIEDNIVTDFVKEPDVDSATQGTLDYSVELNDIEIKKPTRKLTINITFPNAVNENAADYQKMNVTIKGGEYEETFALGTGEIEMTDGAYVVTKDLVKDTTYTVEVSGAGYRTARYNVRMNDNKTLNFWNNVKDNAIEVETGNEAIKKNVTFLAGELVNDGKINIYDLSAVVSYFGATNLVDEHPEYAKYDLNRDGKIDSKDIAYVLVSWGK